MDLHPASNRGLVDVTYWLDFLEVTLDQNPNGLDTLASGMAGKLESHPEKWPSYIAASRVDPLLRKTLIFLLRRLRSRNHGSLNIPPDQEAVLFNSLDHLNAWARDMVTDGDKFSNPSGGDARKQYLRNTAITITVNGIREITELPYESDERKSACHVVADRLGWSYGRVRTAWRKRRPLLRRAQKLGVIPPSRKQKRKKP